MKTQIILSLSIFAALLLTSMPLAAGFPQSKLGEFDEITTVHGTWKRESGKAAVVALPNRPERTGIHLFGPEASIVLTLPETQRLYGLFLELLRWTSKPPFKVFVEIRDGNPNSPWKQVFSLDEKTTVSTKPAYFVSFDPTAVGAVRFRCSTTELYGLFIETFVLKKSEPMKFLRFVPEETYPIAVPICIRGENEAVFQTVFETEGNENPITVDRIKVEVRGSSQLESMKIQSGGETLVQWTPKEGENILTLKVPAKPDKNILQLCATAKSTAKVGANITTWISELVAASQTLKPDLASMTVSPKRRIGYYLVKPADNDVAFYRIPGLATTNKGTLIAVYDLRYKKGGDLPNDIDIGMSRSTDGGQTWEAMKNILDMGGHDDNEGVGDPAILVDRKTGRIWVGALWAHKGITYHNSAPGMKLGASGQFLVVHSDDDGLTWSSPINLTEPLAANLLDPELKTFFDGPGCGITMRDGTLVFPAQFLKGAETIGLWGDMNLFISGCHATVFWSKDNGKTWTLGSGVRPGTTEAQVVELNDGSLLLTVRDHKNPGTRAKFITRDLGKTWEEHSTSNKALPDPVCQASILRVASKKDGDDRNLLAFFNPNSARGRVNLSLQLSEDEGETWSYKELCYAPNNWGYSCMCMVDKSTIGVLYETIGGLIFEKINVNDIIKF
ncbi:MAG: glycoside hydrolase [Planctomycetaceae bacterium]|nr:glycoside hydrolase [Planctomycetaceae bacterium]